MKNGLFVRVRSGLILGLFALLGVSCVDQAELKYPDTVRVDGYGSLSHQSTALDGIPLYDAAWYGSSMVALSEDSVYVLNPDGSQNRKLNLGLKALGQDVANTYSVTVLGNKVVVASRESLTDKNVYWLNVVDLTGMTIARTNLTELFAGLADVEMSLPLAVWNADGAVVIKVMGTDYADQYLVSTNLATWTLVDEANLPPRIGRSDNTVVDGSLLYAIDDRSGSYSNTWLKVSADAGENWSEASLGTNYGRKVLVSGNTVWVACFGYHTQVFIVTSNMIGGGLHRMVWSQ